MINNVVMVGRLTKDADLRYTSSGTAVASFTLAVNRDFTGANGKKEADFISCVAWRKIAETLASYTRKGSLIGVEGRIQTRSYDNQQGQRVYVTEVVSDKVTFMDTKQATDSDKADRTNTSAYNQNATQGNYGANSSTRRNSGEPPLSNATEVDIDDDDLPF